MAETRGAGMEKRATRTRPETRLSSFVVRVYRYEPGGTTRATGIVEFPRTSERIAFHDFSELKAIMIRYLDACADSRH